MSSINYPTLETLRQTLANAQHDLQVVQESHKRFIALAGHELYTPLTTLRGLAQHLTRRISRKTPPSIEEVSESMHVILQQIDQLESILDRLLQADSLANDELSLARQNADLVDILKRVLAVAHRYTDRPGIVVASPPALPVLIDPPRLEHALTNLVQNAIQFCPEGVPIHIELDMEEDEIAAKQYATVRIIDQGEGIPLEYQSHLFERYFQVPSPNRVGGLGLGLYNSKRIAELHGGQLELESSEPGKTCFLLKLPL